MEVNVEQRWVDCENEKICYFLTRKPVKNINLRIKADGRVLISANNRVPTEFIDEFIKEKQNYILSALAKFEEKRKLMREEPKRYVSGENYTLLGKNLRLKVDEAKEEAVYTDGIYIFLKVKDKNNFRHKEIVMDRWLKEYQMMIFKELVDEKYALFQKYGVPYPKLRVRYMTSRWGSCQPKKGIITLNSQLIKVPRNCIEYVVLHEFAHCIHPNHSKQFWDFVAMMMPDWKERKKELEKKVYL
ncbi:MAG: M48 family metallopeptidase [Lachnospiraceae bacterium]|nr:M48 family metallopeptidase [Lachnospiraceae bacterium]